MVGGASNYLTTSRRLGLPVAIRSEARWTVEAQNSRPALFLDPGVFMGSWEEAGDPASRLLCPAGPGIAPRSANRINASVANAEVSKFCVLYLGTLTSKSQKNGLYPEKWSTGHYLGYFGGPRSPEPNPSDLDR